MASIIILTLLVSPAFAKRVAPKPVKSIVKDGIEYSAALDPTHIGFIEATWTKAKQLKANGKTYKPVIWSKQIYVIKYEYKYGLEEDVQWVFISNLRLDNNKLIITNELGYEYELDLDTLSVKVLKGKAVIDNTNWQPESR